MGLNLVVKFYVYMLRILHIILYVIVIDLI